MFSGPKFKLLNWQSCPAVHLSNDHSASAEEVAALAILPLARAEAALPYLHSLDCHTDPRWDNSALCAPRRILL